MRSILLLLIILFQVSNCTENSVKVKGYDSLENPDYSTIIKKMGIKLSKHYHISLDINGRPQWNRLEYVKIYNKDGQVEMVINHRYMEKEIPAKEGGLTLDDLNHLGSLTETNIPSGVIDTTKYFYDVSKNRIREEYYDGIILNIKYDKMNNQVERCVTSKNDETSCYYINWEYKDNRIISKKDSVGISSSNRRPHSEINKSMKKNFFKYDNSGRVIFDGNYQRKFDSQGRLKEIIAMIRDSIPGERHIFEYDNKGNRKLITNIRMHQTWDPITGVTSVSPKDTVYTNYQFNDQNLPIEEKRIISNELTRLEKTEYF